MSLALLSAPTWFAGCGNMAGAMVEGWRAGDVDLSQAVAIRPSGRAVEGVRTVRSFAEAGGSPGLVILGFKPQQLDAAAPELAPWVTSKTIVVSILAGVETAGLRERFRDAKAIVRCMPNLPVSVRRGVVALFGDEPDEALLGQLQRLFSVLGFTHWCATEAEFAAMGAVSGAGPAYVARFMSALARAGEGLGLDPRIAATAVLETVLGTAWLAAASGEGMDSIAKRVASPGGTTQAGLAVLDHDRVLDELVALAISAAARRGAELAAEARTLARKPLLP